MLPCLLPLETALLQLQPVRLAPQQLQHLQFEMLSPWLQPLQPLVKSAVLCWQQLKLCSCTELIRCSVAGSLEKVSVLLRGQILDKHDNEFCRAGITDHCMGSEHAASLCMCTCSVVHKYPHITCTMVVACFYAFRSGHLCTLNKHRSQDKRGQAHASAFLHLHVLVDYSN